MTVESQHCECIQALEAERSLLGDAPVDLTTASVQAHPVATPNVP
jgi:hypothetical protein